MDDNNGGKSDVQEDGTSISAIKEEPGISSSHAMTKPQDFEQEGAAVQISFMNTAIGRKYRHDIETFFHTLMTAENMKKDREVLPKIQSRPNLSAGSKNTVLPEDTTIGCIMLFRWYMIDRMGWPMIANSPDQTPGIELPRYQQNYTEPFPPPQDAERVDEKPIRTERSCFNCGETGHALKGCPKPFDKRAIARNKSKFQASGLQYGRYHTHERARDTQFGRTPGQISEALRHSLGLGPTDIPDHIYHMRNLGYPPGWLIEAKIMNSGLAMFDKHGCEVDLDGDIMEDGEVPESKMKHDEHLQYDPEKLINFQGFNGAPPEEWIDCALHDQNYPRIRPEANISRMAAELNQSPTDDKSRKRNRSRSPVSDQKRHKLHRDNDMEMSDTEENFEVKPEVIEMYVPASVNQAPAEETGTMNEIDITLNQLEEEKQRLLAELCEMGKNALEGSTSTPATNNLVSRMCGIEGHPPTGPVFEDQSIANTSSLHRSIHSEAVTPVIQHSDISKLPDYQKFSEGITEHIPYENLPNSTGVFEKMSNVLRDVKQKMAKFRGKRKKNKKL